MELTGALMEFITAAWPTHAASQLACVDAVHNQHACRQNHRHHAACLRGARFLGDSKFGQRYNDLRTTEIPQSPRIWESSDL